MKKFRIYWTIGICAVILTFILISFGRVVYTTIDDKATTTFKPIDEYDRLFKPDARRKMHLELVFKIGNQEPMSNYLYGGKYTVQVSKVVLSKTDSLRNIIGLKHERTHIGNDIYYTGEGNNFKEGSLSGKVGHFAKLYMRFEGIGAKSFFTGDSLFYCTFRFKNYSIALDNNPPLTYAVARDCYVPISTCFVKRGSYMYIISMTLADRVHNLPEKLLYEIIAK